MSEYFHEGKAPAWMRREWDGRSDTAEHWTLIDPEDGIDCGEEVHCLEDDSWHWISGETYKSLIEGGQK